MPGPLDGRVAIITGAHSPIGRAIVASFLEAGASVLATDLHAGDATAGHGSALDGADDRIEVRVDDLRDAETPTRVVAACIERFGRLDVLANVASDHMFAALAEVQRDVWLDGVLIDLAGATFLAQAAAEHLEATGGTIISISSNHAHASSWRDTGYAAVKSGILGLTHSLATELGPRGVRVNAITPGIVMAKGVPAQGRPEEWLPLRRTGRPDEIASVAVFLASDAASYVTGQEIIVDGGQRAVLPDYAAIRSATERERDERIRASRKPRKRAKRGVGRMLRKVGLLR